MPKFSKSSKEKLESCDLRLQFLFNEAIKMVDFSVVFGHRSQRKQHQLFMQGRDQGIDGKYIVTDSSKIVTNCDGFKKMSNHNYSPSKAIDVIPWPTKYKDINQFYYLAGIILNIAHWWDIPVEWGGHWSTFKDLPHFQIKEV